MKKLLILLLLIYIAGPRLAHAAITETGVNQDFDIAATDTGTVSSTITVPADAQIVIVGISGYSSTQNTIFTGGKLTFTKGGVDTNMIPVTGGDGDHTKGYFSAVFYLVSPDTGTNKSLKWDWNGTVGTDPGNQPKVSVTFWKGIDTSNPVRGTGGAQFGALPYTTPTITALSGDLIVAWAGGFVTTEGTINSWTNLSLLTQVAKSGLSNSDGAWATGSPTGDTTVSAVTGTQFADGGIEGIALEPTPVSSGPPTRYMRLFEGFLFKLYSGRMIIYQQ